ncbi:unnamed protein product [Leptosia nina]|uniref:Uncharacterized protein n=1 Tax=Leptosia nina TaxID=320188 RepID=A0AAV1K187_9NEOP
MRDCGSYSDVRDKNAAPACVDTGVHLPCGGRFENRTIHKCMRARSFACHIASVDRWNPLEAVAFAFRCVIRVPNWDFVDSRAKFLLYQDKIIQRRKIIEVA